MVSVDTLIDLSFLIGFKIYSKVHSDTNGVKLS